MVPVLVPGFVPGVVVLFVFVGGVGGVVVKGN